MIEYRKCNLMCLPNMDQQKGMKESRKIDCFIGPFRALGHNALKHNVFSQHRSGLLRAESKGP